MIKHVLRQNSHEKQLFFVKGHPISQDHFTMIAGPCAIESLAQLRQVACIAKACGAHGLRGGAFKPRTSPYDFQGLGLEALKYLKQVGEEFNLFTISEVMDTREVELVSEYVDILQIGARNMQNFKLLKSVGAQSKPVMLKRGLCATYQEWLSAAEYIALSGNSNIILCERGIRTFETATRNTLDISAIPVLKSLSNLPIFIDPSHAAGRRDLIAPLSRAAIAVGANGLMIEAHPDPQNALSDGKQSLDLIQLEKLIPELLTLKNRMSELEKVTA